MKKMSLDEVQENHRKSLLEKITDFLKKIWDELDKYEKSKRPPNQFEKPKESEEKKEKKIDDRLRKAVEDFQKATLKKSISIKRKSAKSDPIEKRTSSKIGGNPYWPDDKPYPQIMGDNAILLYQINFDEMPKLEGYPSKGILQIFTRQGWVEDIYDSMDVKCFYHKNIVSEDKMLKDIPISTLNLPDDLEDAYFVSDGYLIYIEGKLVDDYINPSIDEWEELLEKSLKENFKDEYTNFNDYRDDLWKLIDITTDKIGGYPYAIQSYYKLKEIEEMPLLINLDSGGEINLGDCGIMNIRIDKKVLANLKFENPINFYWDCY